MKTLKRAFILWQRYKTDGAEYRRLADELGLTATALNKLCWHLDYEKRQRRRAA